MRTIPSAARFLAWLITLLMAAGFARGQCGQWQLIHSENPSSRIQFGMVFDSVRSRTVMYGGQFSSARTTCEWDGTLWTQRSIGQPDGSSTNGGRYAHAMA